MKKLEIFGLVLLFCVISNGMASVIQVPPGDGTLEDAIDAAADGDVLVLLDGLYSHTSGNRVEIRNKFLVIRAAGNNVTPRLNAIDLYGYSSVHLQGLVFEGGSADHFTGVSLDVVDCVFNQAYVGGGDIFVGNEVNINSNIGRNFSFAAGNIFNLSSSTEENFTLNGTYFIGNQVVYEGEDSHNYETIHESGIIFGYTYIIANELKRVLHDNPDFPSDANVSVVTLPTAGSLFSGNLVQLQSVSSSPLIPYNIAAVNVAASGIVITNNTIDVSGFTWLTDGSRGIVHTQAPANVFNNIITGGSTGNMPSHSGSTASVLQNNICYVNAADCGVDNSASNPLFVDTTDYQLATGSPGIDAGREEFFYSDLDGSRNNIGMHGGPYAIDQYKAQRQATGRAPYIYPLMQGYLHADTPSIQVDALGVARLQ